MAIYDRLMDMSVTVFKQRCLDVIRRVERSGRPVTITRRGKVVARLTAASPARAAGQTPWEQLQALGGRCEFDASESVLREKDFTALR